MEQVLMSPMSWFQSAIRPSLVLLGTAVVLGTLDLVFACTYWNVRPSRILQGIAAGWLGGQAFRGGSATAWLGALLHYAMMWAMVGTFYAARRWVPVLTRKPRLSGPLYGLLLYLVMNLIVLPLSAAARPPFVAGWVLSSVAVHVLLVGLPIAWASRWAAQPGSLVPPGSAVS
ncbi:hypothetical protein [Rhodanobacter glycinis]|uniref:hypothetical protein n=1 Tax=Rhodanobacter glycinis TaxID=582702 RepID=UPI001126F564|nr:hypothetical protein [Rhodanobacter glycinis]